MRHPAFHRRMGQLALLAMLLLALIPTAGRLMASRASAGDPIGAGWVELCTVSGLKLVKLAPAALQLVVAKTAASGGDAASLPDHAGDPALPDCGYCPLLQAVLAIWVALLVLAVLRRQHVVSDWRRALAPRALSLRGLGSRGPPLAA